MMASTPADAELALPSQLGYCMPPHGTTPHTRWETRSLHFHHDRTSQSNPHSAATGRSTLTHTHTHTRTHTHTHTHTHEAVRSQNAFSLTHFSCTCQQQPGAGESQCTPAAGRLPATHWQGNPSARLCTRTAVVRVPAWNHTAYWLLRRSSNGRSTCRWQGGNAVMLAVAAGIKSVSQAHLHTTTTPQKHKAGMHSS